MTNYKEILNKYNIEINSNNIIQTAHKKIICDKLDYSNDNFENIYIDDPVLEMINKVIINITGHEYDYFTTIFILNKNDFELIKPILKGNEDMEFDGIRLISQNIILSHDGLKRDSLLRLLFHEIGHSLFKEIDLIEDEKNAMKFELKALDKLVHILNESNDKAFYYIKHDNYLPKDTIHYQAMEYVLKTIDF